MAYDRKDPPYAGYGEDGDLHLIVSLAIHCATNHRIILLLQSSLESYSIYINWMIDGQTGQAWGTLQKGNPIDSRCMY